MKTNWLNQIFQESQLHFLNGQGSVKGYSTQAGERLARLTQTFMAT